MQYPRAMQVARLAKHVNLPLKVLCSGNGDAGIDSENLSVERLYPGWWPTLLDKIRFRILPKTQFDPDPHIRWARLAAKHLLSTHQFTDDDVLVTFGQPMSDHLAGLTVKRATGVKWITHFSDPWVDNPMVRREGSVLRSNQLKERDVIENADAVAFTSIETLELVMQKYPGSWRTKAHIVPHAFDASLYPNDGRGSRGDKLILRYMGNFYGERTPLPLVSALRIGWKQTPEIFKNIRVEIYGSLEKGMKEKMDFSGLSENSIHFYPPIDYLESLKLMVEADLLLVIDAPSDLSVFLPSKLIDYTGAGKPVFGITPAGTSANLIRELGGQVVDPENEYEIAQELSQVIKALSAREQSHPWGDEKVRLRFEASRVAREMEKLIEKVKQAA